jgi:hypothetical protein
MQRLIRSISVIVLLCCTIVVRAQNYPVQVSVQLLPPFSGYLPDYTVTASEQLRAFVVFNDFTVASYNIKFKFSLQGQGITMQSPSWYFMGPVNVQPGVPLMLSGSDLAPLLAVNNLQFTGITPQQYNQQKVLPEGLYTLCITAYDFANPVPIQVSNEACVQVWMGINDPPLLNFPLCESEVNIITPQNITFSWTPLHMNGPTSQLGTEYDFELYEVRPDNNPPGNVLLTQAPIFTLTTTQTMLMYGIAEPPLIPGMEYVWRVRARDVEGRPLFRNNGWSQYCTFTWGNSLSVLGNLAALQLTAQAVNARQAQAQWDSLSVYASYKLQFRKLNTSNWFPQNTNQRTARVNGLEPQTTYEAQVVGILPNGNEGPVSNTVTFTTPAIPVYQCGQLSVAPSMQTFQPLTQATEGMIWQVGQFEMSVLTLQSTANNAGFYSGTGRIVMPLGITVGCTFNGIQIGQDMRMYQGEVRAMSEGVGSWLNGWVSQQFQYDTSIIVNCIIDSVYTNAAGQVVVLCENGSTQIITVDPEGGILIVDPNGNQWVVNENGATYVDNGTVLPFSTDPLSPEELDIMKRAMTLIRNEYTPSVVNQKQLSMALAQQQVQGRTQQQAASLGTNNTSNNSDDDATVIGFTWITPQNDNGNVLGKAFKTAQVDYLSARVLVAISAADASDEDLAVVGNYLHVNNILFRSFVAQQTQAGRTPQQIAVDVTEQGIKPFVQRTVAQQLDKR